MSILIIFAVCAVVVTGHPLRIVGGELTTISQYPHMVSLLLGLNLQDYVQNCGGTILNEVSILTAAHCSDPWSAVHMRARIGSTYANSGGTVYAIRTIFNHPNYNLTPSWDSDVSIIRPVVRIVFNNLARPATISHPDFNVADGQPVWAAGWGTIYDGGPKSEQLRHVQIYVVNQEICRNNFLPEDRFVTDNMICAGVLGVGGRDQCNHDSGGPVYHNGVVVGITSWGVGCADPWLPGVNVRVSRFTRWIQQVAESLS